jgi:bifunctional non-homologous end joining protein LigD
MTAIGAYSPRARPGFPIAVRVTCRAVERGIVPDAFTMESPVRRGLPGDLASEMLS